MCYIDDMISSSSVSEIRPNDHEFDACLEAGKGTLRDKYIYFYVYIPIKLIHFLLVYSTDSTVYLAVFLSTTYNLLKTPYVRVDMVGTNQDKILTQ